MVTRACRVLPKLIMEARRGTAMQLDSSCWRLCTSQAEDKHKTCSGKTLAQTKMEQRWWYDPTIKYEALRRCAVPRYAYYDVSATDWSDSCASASDSEIEAETMAEDEAQNQNNKVFAEAEEEQLSNVDSYVKYGIPKELAYSYIKYGIP